MPSLQARPLFASDGLLFRRVTCDGMDEARNPEERNEDSRFIVVLHGRFAFEDSKSRAIASPTTGLCLADGQTYRIHHIDGGDVCVSLQGDVCRMLLDTGSTVRQVSTRGYVRVQALAAALAAGRPLTRLAIEEPLCDALAPSAVRGPGAGSRERDIAEAIAYRLDRNVDARLSLAEAISDAGVSLFHACRVFRRVTGFSVHGYHQEIRLRHALAWLLDGDRPIARIAVDSGFANQGHLTNLFKRRFNTTPARARTRGLPDQARSPRQVVP